MSFTQKYAAWSNIHGIQKLYSTNYVMTWESLTLDNFRYDLCSLHNDMWGSYERCSRQNHGEGSKGKQAKSVKHLRNIKSINFKKKSCIQNVDNLNRLNLSQCLYLILSHHGCKFPL